MPHSAGESEVTPGLHSEYPALSAPSEEISYDRATKTVLHCPVIFGSSLMLQKLILLEATVRWIGPSFGVAIKEHMPRKHSSWYMLLTQYHIVQGMRGPRKKREMKGETKWGGGELKREILKRFERLNTPGFNHQYASILNKNCQ